MTERCNISELTCIQEKKKKEKIQKESKNLWECNAHATELYQNSIFFNRFRKHKAAP